MRVWDLPVEKLCDRHLLAEHCELHTIWGVLTRGLKGWAHHPETLRWQGRLRALYRRHQAQVGEMTRRGFRHQTPLEASLATGARLQKEYLATPEEQVRMLTERCAGCAAKLKEDP